MAIKVTQCELSQELTAIGGTGAYESVRILVRHHGAPLGWVWIDNARRRSSILREQIRDEILAQLPWELPIHVLGRHFRDEQPDAYHPLCTVLVCTRDRTESLSGCLEALFKLDYPDFEILVVDNAPSDDSTRALVSGLPVRYAREDRPGLDWARNRGLTDARGEIVAFVDDDARPDRGWLRAIARAFAEPEVMAVSGPVAPVELETPAQILFELPLGGMTQSFQRWTVRREQITTTQLLWSSFYAVGTNMAYRRNVFEHEAPFDPALDVGTPSGSGGDLEISHRLVAHGHTLVYEPAALVWHLHRRTRTSLVRQLYANALGFGAYLLTCMRNGTVARSAIVRFALREWLWGWILKRMLRPRGISRRLVWAELAGALKSPWAFYAAQRQARRLAGSRADGLSEGALIGRATAEVKAR